LDSIKKRKEKYIMSAIFNAQLVERGGYFQVTNVYFKEIQFVMPSAKYVLLSNENALKLKSELNQGKLVKIGKDTIYRCSEKPNSPIPLEEFEIVEPDTLQQKKAVEKAKCNQRLAISTAVITALEIFRFFVITSELQARGYNLFTEQNKEETYLEIINTGDEGLISKLETFLEVKDKFDRLTERSDFVHQYCMEIEDCDSEEELQEVVKANNGWLVS
jgi:hypothetical protein